MISASLANATGINSSSTGKVLIIPCEGNTEYTVSTPNFSGDVWRLGLSNNQNPAAGQSYSRLKNDVPTNGIYTFSTNAETKSILLQFGASVFDETIETLMLNLGSTPLPYEPFGYKLTITNAGQTKTVYLSEPIRKIGEYADTISSDGVVTRRINKQAITELANRDNFNGGYTIDFASPCGSNTVLSNIAISTSSLPTAANRQGKVFTNSGRSYIGFGSQSEFPIANTSGYPTTGEKSAFTSYISTHEVYVWYVLATPITEQIQFPEIDTTDGSNTLSVGTTLPPSKISLTGHIKALPSV